MKRKKKKPPANAAAWCKLHQRAMTYVYIHRRKCVLRRCKHLVWSSTPEPI